MDYRIKGPHLGKRLIESGSNAWEHLLSVQI